MTICTEQQSKIFDYLVALAIIRKEREPEGFSEEKPSGFSFHGGTVMDNESTQIAVQLKNEIAIAEKTMSTKQLSEQLNTSPKVILENAKKCIPNKIIEKGKPAYWSKAEIALILEQLKNSNPNQNAFTGAVKAVSTELTPALKIKRAMLLMQEGYEEELAVISRRAEIAETKNGELLVKLDESQQYITIKRMETLNKGKRFDWRALKSESKKLNLPPKDAYDQNYGSVKAYHANVWESLYFDSITYPDEVLV